MKSERAFATPRFRAADWPELDIVMTSIGYLDCNSFRNRDSAGLDPSSTTRISRAGYV
jgi:hypothetical protein